jgi:hypothetical protein
VTPSEVAALIDQYRVGLEAELVLLKRLQQVATRQQETSEASDVEALQRIADERDSLMSGLMAIEQELRGVRDQLSASRDAARRVPGFDRVVTLHETVAGIVKQILRTDEDSIKSLERIVLARRVAAQALEQGESTLAAYGRLVAPPAATLVNRRG